MAANGHEETFWKAAMLTAIPPTLEETFWKDGNVLKLVCGDGYTILQIC